MTQPPEDERPDDQRPEPSAEPPTGPPPYAGGPPPGQAPGQQPGQGPGQGPGQPPWGPPPPGQQPPPPPGWAPPGQPPAGQQPPPGQQPPQGWQPPPPGWQPPPPGYGHPPNPAAPYGVHPVSGVPYSDKSKVIAGVLQLVIPLGIGRFYIGDTNKGIAQLLVTIFTCGIGALWPFIDGILILVNDDTTDAYGRPLRPS